MKIAIKALILSLLLTLSACAHHSAHYSSHSGSVDYDIGVSGHSSYSHPVYYDRHVYIETPVIHDHRVHTPLNEYRNSRYDKHKKQHVDKHFLRDQRRGNSKPYRGKSYSTSKRYKKHEQSGEDNYLSTNKYSSKEKNYRSRSYSSKQQLTTSIKRGKHSKGFSSR